MPELYIDKEITIHAPVSETWKVLVKKQYTEQWTREFSEGNVVTEDWHLNSRMTMTGDDGTVLSEGAITQFEPFRRLKMEFENGKYTEELTLTAKGGLTHFYAYAGPVAHAEHQKHSEVWQKGLNKIKELAETL